MKSNRMKKNRYLPATLAALAVYCAWGRPAFAGMSSGSVECPAGMEIANGTNCCWPGQRFSPERETCSGRPQCPPGMVASGARCVAAPAPSPGVPVEASPSAAAPTQPTEPSRSTDGARGLDIPPGYHIEMQPRKGLMITGSTMAGAAYVLGAFSASSMSSESPGIYLYIPVLGPLIGLAALPGYDMAECERKTTGDKVCPYKDDAAKGFVILGIGQLLGHTLWIYGAASKRRVLVADVVTQHALTVAPFYAGTKAAGLTLTGSF